MDSNDLLKGVIGWRYSIAIVRLSCWLGLKEYQVRGERSLYRHWILVFCAYSFIVWHTLTGGLRRSDAHQPLETFTDALEAFRTAISYRFVRWFQENMDVFTAYKASFGFIWA